MRFVYVLVALLAWGGIWPLLAQTIVRSCDPAELRAALAKGGQVLLDCDGTFSLTNTLTIAVDTALDASLHAVTLAGNGVTRLLTTSSNVSLTLIHLTLTGGQAGQGGAVYNTAGKVQIQRCTFENNRAIGDSARRVLAEGGAIYSRAGDLVVSESLFLTNSAAPGQGKSPTPPDALGGAIAAEGGSVTLSNCAFTGNHAQGGIAPLLIGATRGAGRGGALALSRASATLQDCVFEQNVAHSDEPPQVPDYWNGADAAGGAILQEGGEATLARCRFVRNEVQAGSGSRDSVSGSGFGGAIMSDGPLTASECTFDSNAVNGAGGIAFFGGNANGGALYSSATVTIEDSFFASNTASAGTGCNCGSVPGASHNGHALGGAVFASGTLQGGRCAFSSNRVTAPDTAPMLGPVLGGCYGGAVYSRGTTLLTNSTWFGNATVPQRQFYPPGFGDLLGPASGAAVFQTNGALTLVNCTLATNVVSDTNVVGAGVQVTGNARAQALGCILSGNLSVNWSGPLEDGGHNLSSDSAMPLTAPTSRMQVDARLGPFGFDGGLTPTLPLRADSPAIDALSAPCLDLDQRGIRRPIGSSCDIGAYEFVPAPVLSAAPDQPLELRTTLNPSTQFLVQSSADLRAWRPLTNALSNAQGQLSITDPTSSNQVRFYRFLPAER